MYQEAIEQSAHDISIFEFAKFALTCPRTEFAILQPNPELERLDAALAAMCQPDDDEFEDFPVIPRPDRIDDLNAITFIEPKMLEKLFEMYDGDRPRFYSENHHWSDHSPSHSSRSYHPGHIYGPGRYGNDEQERRYQSFIHDPYLVFDVLDELLRKEANLRSESRRYKWDEPRITMTIPSGPTEIEEGEIVYDSLQVYDNQGQEEEDEPFIRAPVVSDEAAEIMADEFYYMRHNWKPLWTEDA